MQTTSELNPQRLILPTYLTFLMIALSIGLDSEFSESNPLA